MKNVATVGLLLFLFVITFVAGKKSVQPTNVEVEKVVYDTIVITQIKHDTMWRDRVVYKRLPAIDDSTDTIRIVDTVTVSVPIYKYHFSDKMFSIKAEGHDVKLNEVVLYPRTEYRTKEVKVANKWGLGIQAGYGVSSQGLTPYIGIGISYNILTW